MFVELNLTLRPTYFDASGHWHHMANPQSEGQQPEAVNPVWDGLSNFITQIFQSPLPPPSLSSSHHYLYPVLATCPPWVCSPKVAARLGTAQGCPFFPSLPEEAGRHENTGLTSELRTSHPLAIQDYSGSTESWLPTDNIIPKPYPACRCILGVELQGGVP